MIIVYRWRRKDIRRLGFGGLKNKKNLIKFIRRSR